MQRPVWIAVRREHRACAPADWQQRVLALGAERLGGDDKRMKALADAEQIAAIERELGEVLVVEPTMHHQKT